MSLYFEKLQDPRWQRKRLEIFNRDSFKCRDCGATESSLHIHHTCYKRGFEPWDYEAESLLTLCQSCHLDRAKEEQSLLITLAKFNRESIYFLRIGLEELLKDGFSPAGIRFLLMSEMRRAMKEVTENNPYPELHRFLEAKELGVAVQPEVFIEAVHLLETDGGTCTAETLNKIGTLIYGGRA